LQYTETRQLCRIEQSRVPADGLIPTEQTEPECLYPRLRLQRLVTLLNL